MRLIESLEPSFQRLMFMGPVWEYDPDGACVNIESDVAIVEYAHSYTTLSLCP